MALQVNHCKAVHKRVMLVHVLHSKAAVEHFIQVLKAGRRVDSVVQCDALGADRYHLYQTVPRCLLSHILTGAAEPLGESRWLRSAMQRIAYSISRCHAAGLVLGSLSPKNIAFVEGQGDMSADYSRRLSRVCTSDRQVAQVHDACIAIIVSQGANTLQRMTPVLSPPFRGAGSFVKDVFLFGLLLHSCVVGSSGAPLDTVHRRALRPALHDLLCMCRNPAVCMGCVVEHQWFGTPGWIPPENSPASCAHTGPPSPSIDP
jgi:hypothetical protein